MLIFFHTREPDSCSFLQYGYFSFDKCFPWGLTSSSACTHLRNPQWQEHTLEENIFTSPVAVTIINYLFFCQSSIWKQFWGWGFLPSFVWLDANRAPLGMWLCWCTPDDFKEIRMAQRRSAGPRTQKWTKVTNTKTWHVSGLGQRLGLLKTWKAAEPRVNIAIELSCKMAEKCGQDMMEQMKLCMEVYHEWEVVARPDRECGGPSMGWDVKVRSDNLRIGCFKLVWTCKSYGRGNYSRVWERAGIKVISQGKGNREETKA